MTFEDTQDACDQTDVHQEMIQLIVDGGLYYFELNNCRLLERG